MNDFIEISIINTAVKCGIAVNINTNRVEVAANCPFCNDRKRHLSLNSLKNLYRCNRCGESGNAVQLYAKLMGGTTKIAYHELCEGVAENNNHSLVIPEREPAPLSKRHIVYTNLLNMLSLSEKHRQNLINRGLDSSAIVRNLYRTIPNKSQSAHITEILSRNHNLIGIPGFYTNNGAWHIVCNDGMFIPVRDENGFIQGLQIRLDYSNDSKYKWFSSRYKKDGTPAKTWIHVANWRNNNTAYVTEGALKADSASHLNADACYIGIAGVNCTNGLIELLRRMGVSSVIEALDMDKYIKPHVYEAALALRSKIAATGIISCTAHNWDERCNGIDDYLLFCRWLDTSA